MSCGIVTTSGCSILFDNAIAPGTLFLENRDSIPHGVQFHATNAPTEVPNPETSLSGSYSIAPGKKQKYTEYIEFPGEYAFQAELSNGDTAEIRKCTFNKNEAGRLDGPAIQFTIDIDGTVGWNLLTVS